jgi:hypothetical protein
MQHADKHKGFWRPGFTIPKELVDHIPAEYVDHSGKPLRGKRWIKGPSTGIRITDLEREGEAQKLINAFGERYVEPAITAARHILHPPKMFRVVKPSANLLHRSLGLGITYDLVPEGTRVESPSMAFDDLGFQIEQPRPIVDVTPTKGPVDLETVMDHRETDLHADGKRSRPEQVVNRRKAWRAAMLGLFKWGKERGKPSPDDMGTYTDTDMEAYRTYLVRLDMASGGTLSFHRIYAIRAMFRCAKVHKLIAIDPCDRKGFQPRKQKKATKPQTVDELRRVLPAALRSPKPAVKFGVILSRYTGANNSEIFEAMASEFYQIGEQWVWDTRGRILKDPRGDGEHRGRLTPLHPAVIGAGFPAYIATRTGKRLFDGSANVHSDDCNTLCHKPDDGEKIEKTFKSLRKVFTDQITKAAGKVLGSESMGEYLSGHRPESIHRGWYVFHELPENFPDVVQVIDALPAMPVDEQRAAA